MSTDLPRRLDGCVDGRVAVITGANRGVGRGLALAFAAAGARVVVTARDLNAGRVVAEEIVARGGEARCAPCDVTVRADVDAAIDSAVSWYGGVDVMVHNAVSVRSSEPHELAHTAVDVWDEHVAVSVRGAYRCAVAVYPHLRDRAGAFLLLTSPAGINGSATLPFYAGVKGAQRAFVKSLAREWGPDGVRVNGLAPLAATPALERAFAADPAMRDRLGAIVPL
ncbi:MAG: SDR family oxidoreductase, partial [Actinobacteria bacterium]|nr:SDR family oxidoreductase [Actinomycetota bacterium]